MRTIVPRLVFARRILDVWDWWSLGLVSSNEWDDKGKREEENVAYRYQASRRNLKPRATLSPHASVWRRLVS